MMNEFPHVCDMDHDEVGYRNDQDPCPVCMEIGRRENAECERRRVARKAGEFLKWIYNDPTDPKDLDNGLIDAAWTVLSALTRDLADARRERDEMADFIRNIYWRDAHIGTLHKRAELTMRPESHAKLMALVNGSPD